MCSTVLSRVAKQGPEPGEAPALLVPKKGLKNFKKMLKFLPRLRIKTSVVVLYSTHCSLTIRYRSQVFTVAFKMKVSALL